jgi:hypothetical protein
MSNVSSGGIMFLPNPVLSLIDLYGAINGGGTSKSITTTPFN